MSIRIMCWLGKQAAIASGRPAVRNKKLLQGSKATAPADALAAMTGRVSHAQDPYRYGQKIKPKE